MQLSTLLSIKTGGCPEDCKYCPQAARYHTGVENEPMLAVDAVVAAAKAAKANGATRFCMGAAGEARRTGIFRRAETRPGRKALALESRRRSGC